MNKKDIDHEGKALLAEALEKVNGGNWAPPGTDKEDDLHLLPFTPTDGINEKGVYIGVNIPHEGYVGACLNHG